MSGSRIEQILIALFRGTRMGCPKVLTNVEHFRIFVSVLNYYKPITTPKSKVVKIFPCKFVHTYTTHIQAYVCVPEEAKVFVQWFQHFAEFTQILKKVTKQKKEEKLKTTKMKFNEEIKSYETNDSLPSFYNNLRYIFLAIAKEPTYTIALPIANLLADKREASYIFISVKLLSYHHHYFYYHYHHFDRHHPHPHHHRHHHSLVASISNSGNTIIEKTDTNTNLSSKDAGIADDTNLMKHFKLCSRFHLNYPWAANGSASIKLCSPAHSFVYRLILDACAMIITSHIYSFLMTTYQIYK
uniref:Uncharacterized protein n=1 Tax=Glossina brevipalpis TaxID=37001 RepID=A0A1A9WFJ0_9MUSC